MTVPPVIGIPPYTDGAEGSETGLTVLESLESDPSRYTTFPSPSLVGDPGTLAVTGTGDEDEDEEGGGAASSGTADMDMADSDKPRCPSRLPTMNDDSKPEGGGGELG